MGHNHNHPHSSSSNLKTAFFLNFAFAIIEFIGGILTNSTAIIAESFHDFGDSLSLGLSWWLEGYSKKKRSEKYSYGYKRFSLLAALINSTILITGSIIVICIAVPRLLNPEPSNYTGMLILAVLGILVNGVAALRLKKGNSLNEKVASWHLLEDVFSWIAVLAVSIINHFVEIAILDPILAIVFTLIILLHVFRNFKQIVSVFLQGIPANVDIKEVERKIKELNGVESVHDIHIWTMDNEYHVLTLHVVVKNKLPYSKMKKIKCEVKKIVGELNIQHVTVEIGEKSEKCDYINC
ncbi:MAG: cation transporter [Candidatus Aenigmarchaeota archaeon]|nr:cation transporter [Candidatus Aenigmarchaeota archaeon]